MSLCHFKTPKIHMAQYIEMDTSQFSVIWTNKKRTKFQQKTHRGNTKWLYFTPHVHTHHASMWLYDFCCIQSPSQMFALDRDNENWSNMRERKQTKLQLLLRVSTRSWWELRWMKMEVETGRRQLVNLSRRAAEMLENWSRVVWRKI